MYLDYTNICQIHVIHVLNMAFEVASLFFVNVSHFRSDIMFYAYFVVCSANNILISEGSFGSWWDPLEVDNGARC